jgi:hypothetical protein
MLQTSSNKKSAVEHHKQNFESELCAYKNLFLKHFPSVAKDTNADF